jgi:5-(carboxyamino)imidazole ribonucleotide synthase
VRAPFDDREALAAFAAAVDVVTVEFENVPAETLEAIAPHAPVRPGPRAFATARDRVEEKAFLKGLGIATAPWAAVDGPGDLAAAVAEVGTPARLKTRRMGYDGKGQARIAGPGEAEAAHAIIGGGPAILEGEVPFTAELSVIAARGLDGQVIAYDPGENVHRDGILRTTTVPARVPRRVAQDAVLTAGRILGALEHVGVMGVEMFLRPGALLVNEIAPRVHNTGHWTIEACVIDQFACHMRAICGWPIGEGTRHSDAVMENLIGDEAARWETLAGEAAGLHLYGKGDARPGRKMGHVTRLAPRSD